MDTQKASTKKVALNYGLILAIASIFLSAIVYAMGQHYDQPIWQTVVSVILMITIIVLGLRQYKKSNGGYMSLVEALKTGLAISLIAGIIGVIYQIVFTSFIEPDFVQNMLDITEQNIKEKYPSLTQEQVDANLSISETMMSPGVMAAIGIIISLFLGFIISLVAGLIMKTNKPN